jgi:hypothetical protein
MTMVTKALDPFSEVVDEERRWTPAWYTFISTVSRVGKVADLPVPPPTNPTVTKPIEVATIGDRAFVTDSTTGTFADPPSGGGNIRVPVYFDGAVWRIG